MRMALPEAEEGKMKKELLKGFTMLLLLVAIAFATALVSANAQSTQPVTADPESYEIVEVAAVHR